MPPAITWLSPPKGHVRGGTLLTLYGSGFKRSPDAKVRFASELEFTEVDLVYVSDSEARCVTPARIAPSVTHVTASNDGRQYSGWPLVYAKGSGTFLKFVYDDSDAGCFDCRDANGINPLEIVERWHLDNTSGPYIGGTLVTIRAVALDWARAQEKNGVNAVNASEPYDLTAAGGLGRYSGPVGGPGAPHPHNVDPTSNGNGPPVTGTFYPGASLRCRWECFLDADQNASTGLNYTVDGVVDPDGVFKGVESLDDGRSDWIPATWHDYTKITCESPPMPVPSAPGKAIGKTRCKIRVTNDPDGSLHPDAYAMWTYEDNAPTVTNIRTNQNSVWPARGPFGGNTEVIVTGTNFLPSKYLKCKFGGISAAENADAFDDDDDVSHVVGEMGGKARYVSSTQIICVTPPFGPAASVTQYPPGYMNKTAGAGALVDVVAFADRGDASYDCDAPKPPDRDDGCDAIDSDYGLEIVGGGKGYMTPPRVTLEGGGGCCAELEARVDAYGAVVAVDVVRPGMGYNRGYGAAAAVTMSRTPGTKKNGVTSVQVTEGGSGYLVPPEVLFRCPDVDPVTGDDVSADPRWCFAEGDVSAGARTPEWAPGHHARAVAVLGHDPSCDRSSEKCRGQGAVVRVDVLFGGEWYASPPEVSFRPGRPYVRVVAEKVANASAAPWRTDPGRVGGYSKQGKGWDELDPEGNHTGTNTTAGAYDVEYERHARTPRERRRLPGVDASASDPAKCPGGICPEARNPEDRGPLLPPLGRAFMDGSIKPGHQELVRVSNNYNKFGAVKGNDQAAPRTHQGNRDRISGTGYWLWSTSGMTRAEMNRCRVSNNPPLSSPYGDELQGHGLDAALGFGTADDEAYTTHSKATRLGLVSVPRGAPGSGAAAEVTSIDPNTGGVSSVTVTVAGSGYAKPPTVYFKPRDGLSGYGAKARAVTSGGTVYRIEVTDSGAGYDVLNPPEVLIAAVRDATAYDANVGHGTYALDETAMSVHGGKYAMTSNYMVGHGAFPGHPGNANLGHPRRDCVYFLYSDVYVSPSGSDSTGQGTAGRPYRTIQKCIDASLSGSRDYYVYKRSDGGDPDPRVPDGAPRYGTESEGETPDARTPTDPALALEANTPTGYDQGYTGTQMRTMNDRRTGWRSARTGKLYGGRSWSDQSRESQRGFGYSVNRDRCVLKDGTYWGEGNRELQPHGHVIEVWAENAQNVVVDCGGRSVGKNVFTADRHAGERGAGGTTGSVSLRGVVMRRCVVRADPAANHRPHYPGRPGYGPGTKNPNGQECVPGPTGCQYRTAVDGLAAGQ